MNWTNIKLIWFREIRDQLRDRRTIFSLAILPLVMYPLMGMSFLKIAQSLGQHPSAILFLGEANLPADPDLIKDDLFADKFLPSSEAGLVKLLLPDSAIDTSAAEDPRELLIRKIRDGDIDAAIYVPPEFTSELEKLRRAILEEEPSDSADKKKAVSAVPSPEILANLADDRSRIAYDRAERILRRWRDAIVRDILRDSQLPESAVEPFQLQSVDVSDEPFRRAALWSKVLPFVVFIWALTGAFYPAIDLCAGEKERGTLETLLCSPALRSEIVWGKLLTVISFSTVTALLNLASLGITGVLLFGRLSSMGEMGAAMQIGPPPAAAIGWLLLAIVPIAALFSATALAIAAFARSSKEGQYYLMPLLLITMPLMIVPLLPAAELDMGSSLIPVSGMMLWLRTLIEGDYWTAGRFALPVIGVTAACCWMAIRWAERQFQSESVLFRESERFGLKMWMQHMMRDRDDTPSAPEAIACGLLLLLLTFFAGLQMTMPRDWIGIAQTILATQMGLIAAPVLIMAVILTTNPLKTLLLKRPRLLAVLAAILLAVSLNPTAVLMGQMIQHTYPPNEETINALKPLSDAMMLAPWWQVLLIAALSPAICEELAFRGFILSGLRHLGSPTAAILISSLLFGVCHGMLQQSLSTTFIGIVIGFIAVRSGSLLPCVAFHFTHNSLSVMISRLAADEQSTDGWLSWLIRRDSGGLLAFHYPWPVVVGGMLLAVFLLGWFYRQPFEQSAEELQRRSLNAS